MSVLNLLLLCAFVWFASITDNNLYGSVTMEEQTVNFGITSGLGLVVRTLLTQSHTGGLGKLSGPILNHQLVDKTVILN